MTWVKVRGGCWSFCLYLWNWWPSIFKLYFHNVCTSYNNDLMKLTKIKCVLFLYFQRNLTEYYSAVDTENMMKLFARFVHIKMIYCKSDWLICLEKKLVILDNLGWYWDVTNIFIRQRHVQIFPWNNRN